MSAIYYRTFWPLALKTSVFLLIPPQCGNIGALSFIPQSPPRLKEHSTLTLNTAREKAGSHFFYFI